MLLCYPLLYSNTAQQQIESRTITKLEKRKTWKEKTVESSLESPSESSFGDATFEENESTESIDDEISLSTADAEFNQSSPPLLEYPTLSLDLEEELHQSSLDPEEESHQSSSSGEMEPHQSSLNE